VGEAVRTGALREFAEDDRGHAALGMGTGDRGGHETERGRPAVAMSFNSK
jgi:hypothetical protein